MRADASLTRALIVEPMIKGNQAPVPPKNPVKSVDISSPTDSNTSGSSVAPNHEWGVFNTLTLVT